MKKITAIIVLVSIIISTSGCATITYNKSMTRAEQKKVDQENSFNMWKGISAFGGVIAGGLTGIAVGPQNNKIATMSEGCLLGGLAGFAISYFITENIKNSEPKPDSSNADEQFRDYRNIQGKE